MPANVGNIVTTYARLGPVVTLPASSAISNTLLYQFSEIIGADLLFYCNYTQVYLKNFLPVSLDIVGNVSFIAASLHQEASMMLKLSRYRNLVRLWRSCSQGGQQFILTGVGSARHPADSG